MSILATLRQDRAGEWSNLDDYLRDLRRRETGALAALASALSVPGPEQRELADHGEGGAVLLEVACDLRVPKGARLAAARCLVEAGIPEPFVGHLFAGAGDLATDPRLGAAARKIVEAGLPCALRIGGDYAQISLAAGGFARAVHAAASAVGTARVKELLADAPPLHAGALAGAFALGLGELPEGHRAGWARLLEQTCAAHRRAPAAAKRLGLAPAWPPNLPEAFGPLIRDAEQRSEAVKSQDALAPPPETGPRTRLQEPARLTKTAKGMAVGRPGKMGPPIRKSPSRRPAGTVTEVPRAAPQKQMEPVSSRSAPAEAGDDLRFDSRGHRIPRPDRWSDEGFAWEKPVLPPSGMPPPARVAAAEGRFEPRLRSMLEDRPEAIDRFCAAAEARAAIHGEQEVLRELQSELSRSTWRDKRPPEEQLQRLRSIVEDGTYPASWRAAARLVLAFFVSGGG